MNAQVDGVSNVGMQCSLKLETCPGLAMRLEFGSRSGG